MYSIITAWKLNQTMSLTSLNFSTTLLLRRFFYTFTAGKNPIRSGGDASDEKATELVVGKGGFARPKDL